CLSQTTGGRAVGAATGSSDADSGCLVLARLIRSARLPTFKITVAYDGGPFVGWQRQTNGTSVQGLIEDALRTLDDRDVTVHGAGRTDAGVHALGQVASFTLRRDITAAVVQRALNNHLPDAVRIVSA